LILLLALFVGSAFCTKYQATDSIMVSKFLSEHRHSYEIIALFFMRS